MVLKIVSLNLLIDLRFWEKRKLLVLDELKRLKPDIIALQEVSLFKMNGQWLADQLGGYRVYLCPKTGVNPHEGLAILSKLSAVHHQTVSFGKQKRVAQSITIKIDDKLVNLANTHLIFEPVSDRARLTQVEKLVDWLPSPAIVCGDFNAEPESQSMTTIKKRFSSAYEAVHGHEPNHTCPTPLKRGLYPVQLATQTGMRLAGLYKHRRNMHWHGTLDYIYTEKTLQVNACHLAFTKASATDNKMYASDHFGLVAEIEI